MFSNLFYLQTLPTNWGGTSLSLDSCQTTSRKKSATARISTQVPCASLKWLCRFFVISYHIYLFVLINFCFFRLSTINTYVFSVYWINSWHCTFYRNKFRIYHNIYGKWQSYSYSYSIRSFIHLFIHIRFNVWLLKAFHYQLISIKMLPSGFTSVTDLLYYLLIVRLLS